MFHIFIVSWKFSWRWYILVFLSLAVQKMFGTIQDIGPMELDVLVSSGRPKGYLGS